MSLIRDRRCRPEVCELAEHALAQHLGEADDGVERGAELVRHVGEELRLGLARPGQLVVEHLELMAGPPLLVVELTQLLAHVVHPSREGAELVAVHHVDARAEVPLGDAAEKPLGLPHGKDEGPGDDEAQDKGKEDRGGGEARGEDEGAAIGNLYPLAEPPHALLLGTHGLGHQGGDLPIYGIGLVDVQFHRVVALALPDQLGDARHRGHDLLLPGPDAPDGVALLGRHGRFEAVEGIEEAVVLAEHALDGGVVADEQRVPCEVHLQAEGLLDLPGGVDPLARLIQEPAMARHAGDRLKAHGAHGDEEEGDEEEGSQQLGVHRRPEPGDPAHEGAQGRVGEEEARDPLAQARKRFRSRHGGNVLTVVLRGAHAR